jgi:protein-L-isoaspartate(D-aspartate) O-methyltransferase
MTQEAKLHPTARVLEIGTGSGYQAAVLSELGAEVYSIEIIPELSASAQKTLSELGYDKVKLKCGDGAQGWPEFAPFDAILITACCPAVPSELLRQLKDRGRLIAPVEDADGDGETLIVITREEDRYLERRLSSVRFVPMTGSVREAS